MNLTDHERFASTLFGVALLGAGLSRGGAARWFLLLVGAALFRRGFTGHCPAYEAASVDKRHEAGKTTE